MCVCVVCIGIYKQTASPAEDISIKLRAKGNDFVYNFNKLVSGSMPLSPAFLSPPYPSPMFSYKDFLGIPNLLISTGVHRNIRLDHSISSI